MTRTPLALAALASAAVPGLDPVSVEGVVQRPGHRFESAFVRDTQARHWVVRAPISPADSAQLDVCLALLGLLARRLPFSVPTPMGFAALGEGGRAVVYPYIAGRPLDFAQLPAGPGVAAELGRALAALHNIDLALCEEAGLTSYDPDTYRTRRLSDLDRAAGTGQVPVGLLARWERSLEDVSLWRFAPTPTHGNLTGDEVLAVFDDEHDSATGRIHGMTGWENAKFADPADDFATLVTQASPAGFDSVLEAYAHARIDRPDMYLERRARLAGELQLVAELLTGVGSGDENAVKACAARLRRLDTSVRNGQTREPVVPTPPSVPTAPLVPKETGVNGDTDVTQVTEVIQVTGVSEEAEVTEVIQVTGVSEEAEVTEVIRVTGVSEEAEVTEVIRVTGVTGVTGVSEEAEVIEVTEVTGRAWRAGQDGPGGSDGPEEKPSKARQRH